MESMVGARFFFQYGLEVRILVSMNVGKIPAIYCLYGGKFGCVRVPPNAVRVVQCTHYVPEAHAKLPGRIETLLMPWYTLMM